MSIDLGGIARVDREGEWVPFEGMEAMERKLAACRAALFCILRDNIDRRWGHAGGETSAMILVSETLEATKP